MAKEPVSSLRKLWAIAVVPLSDRLQHAAVDVIGGADRIAGAVRAEEDEEVRQFLRRREALDPRGFTGDALEIAFPVAPLVGRQLLRRLDPVRRQRQPGIDAVDADVVGYPFCGQR